MAKKKASMGFSPLRLELCVDLSAHLSETVHDPREPTQLLVLLLHLLLVKLAGKRRRDTWAKMRNGHTQMRP